MSDDQITIETIEAAEKLVGVSYTLEERELMLDNLNGQIEAARARRALRFDNSLPMALRFDPRLPGFPAPPPQTPLRPSATDPGPLPESDEDIAFAPLTRLSRWIARGETLKVVALPYIEAARSQGASNWRIVRLHVLPNIMPPVIVQATISVAFAILAEAGLSFLGLGTQPPTPSWGLMIQASRDYLDVAAWTALVPGIAVALTVLGLNMLGDVLRDVLDPTVVAEH